MSSGTLYLGENAVSPSVASALVKYSAGNNVQITNDLVISATDTKYTAGENVIIDANNTISAKSYTAGAGIEVTENGVINATTVQFPDTTGHELSFLMTDGENVSWEKLAIFNLLDRKESDHILNDVRWLRADTFSWQDSELYPAIYEHLANEYGANISSSVFVGAQYRAPERDKVVNGVTYYCWGSMYTITETPAYGDSFYAMSGGSLVSIPNYPVLTNDTLKTDTFGDIAITYFLAEDGHKICFPDQEEQIIALYETSKSADYFILDFTNKRFKLPRKNKRKIAHTYRQDAYWYNLYSDGWVEQGNHLYKGSSISGTHVITFIIPFADTKYNVLTSISHNTAGGSPADDNEIYPQRTPESFSLTTKAGWYGYSWEAKGYASSSIANSYGDCFEYYYVGDYKQTSVEQIASITTENINSKVDLPTGVSQGDVDFVVKWQRPSEANGYIWYRKYKSGWVEQGGDFGEAYTSYTTKTITLPIEMADTKYSVCLTNATTGDCYAPVINSKTVTTFAVLRTTNYQSLGTWQVSGMAA